MCAPSARATAAHSRTISTSNGESQAVAKIEGYEYPLITDSSDVAIHWQAFVHSVDKLSSVGDVGIPALVKVLASSLCRQDTPRKRSSNVIAHGMWTST